MELRTKSFVRGSLLLILLIGSVFILAACGGSSSPSKTTTVNGNEAHDLSALAAQEKVSINTCLASNGIHLSSSSGSTLKLPKGVSPAKYEAILSKCRGSKIPQSLQPPAVSGTQKAAFNVFISCMRQHGFHLTPEYGTYQGLSFTVQGANVSAPAFKAADKICYGSVKTELTPAKSTKP